MRLSRSNVHKDLPAPYGEKLNKEQRRIARFVILGFIVLFLGIAA